MSFQGLENVFTVPAGLPKLDCMAPPLGKCLQECPKPHGVVSPARRELIEDGAEVGAELLGSREEALERLLRVLQLLHVREISAGLDREEEPGGGLPLPSREPAGFGQSVEAVVQLDGVEDGGVVAEPLFFWGGFWGESFLFRVFLSTRAGRREAH